MFQVIKNNDTVTKTKEEITLNTHSSEQGQYLDEKLIHEHGTERENNVNTRSYVFFNQGYVAPIRNDNYIKHYDMNLKTKKIPTQTLLTDSNLYIATYGDLSNRFSMVYSATNKLKNEVLINNFHSKGLNNKSLSQANGTGVQQHYLQALIPSLIKSKNYRDHKVPYVYLSKNDLSRTDITKHSHYCNKTQNSPQKILRSNIAKKPVNKYHDIARLFSLHKPTHGHNRLISNPEYFDLDRHVGGDVIKMRLDTKEIGEKGLAANAMASGKKFESHENCNYLGCIAAGKRYHNNKLICDCQKKRERLSRQELEHNETEVLYGYYTEITEDSVNNTVNDDLLNTLNKLNDTLEMYQ